jgi:hypothetical protein
MAASNVNSTWLVTTNKILELRGQLQITSANNFNNPTQLLTRVQSLARAFVDMCDRMLNLRRNNRDTLQEFAITTQAGNPNNINSYMYTLDPSIHVENVRYYSFFNITAQGTGTTVAAQPIYNIEYREFRQLYPDFTAITTGPPQNWIILPKTAVQPGPGLYADTIIFYPIPDAAYKIVYQAKTDATPLTKDTDQILWAPPYEHILWHWAGMYLEDALGEGKGQLMSAYAEKALSEYWFWVNRGAEEERHAIRTGMKITGLLKGRRVNSYSDTPSSGT